MKAKIYRDMTGQMLAKRRPPALRDDIAARRFDRENGLFTLLVFPLSKKSPVFAGALEQALKTVPPGQRLVVYGPGFTLQSLALLDDRQAETFTLSDFPWTEESYTRIRESSASPRGFLVKSPR